MFHEILLSLRRDVIGVYRVKLLKAIILKFIKKKKKGAQNHKNNMLSTTLIPYEKYIQQCCISIVEHCGISLASIKAQQKLVSVTTILYGRSVKHSVEEIFILIWDFPSFFMASVSLTSLLSTKYSTKEE